MAANDPYLALIPDGQIAAGTAHPVFRESYAYARRMRGFAMTGMTKRREDGKWLVRVCYDDNNAIARVEWVEVQRDSGTGLLFARTPVRNTCLGWIDIFLED